MSRQIFQIPADHFGFQNRFDDMLRGLRRFARARKKIGVTVAFDAPVGDDRDQQAARDRKIIRRRDQRLGVRHFQYAGFNPATLPIVINSYSLVSS